MNLYESSIRIDYTEKRKKKGTRRKKKIRESYNFLKYIGVKEI